MVRSSRLAHDGSTWLSWFGGSGKIPGPRVVLVLRGAAGRTVPDRRRAGPGRVAPAGTQNDARHGRGTPGEGAAKHPDRGADAAGPGGPPRPPRRPAAGRRPLPGYGTRHASGPDPDQLEAGRGGGPAVRD